MTFIPLDVVVRGNRIFEHLKERDSRAEAIVLGNLLPLALLPPIFLYVGSTYMGWEIGAEQAIRLTVPVLLFICGCYFIALFVGLIGMAVMLRWMAPTYHAELDFARHLTLVSVVATPMVIGSIAHLYPHVFINMLVIIPALICSMYLLYKGTPVVLKTTPQQGMLMASSLIGILLVGVVTLLGLTVVLWTHGFGPSLGL